MPIPKMRVFAGPNGSGKTTILSDLRDRFQFGVYVNADDIELGLGKRRQLDFGEYRVSVTSAQVQQFFKLEAFSPGKTGVEDLWKQVRLIGDILTFDSSVEINSYLAADVAELIRRALLESRRTFTFETVMSHSSKLDFIKQARNAGFRIYLYFVATEDPEINIGRVNVRVAQSGHGVTPEIVRSRYTRSLLNLKSAIQLSDRAYIFDNSGVASRLVAEVTAGSRVEIIESEFIPSWFVRYVLGE